MQNHKEHISYQFWRIECVGYNKGCATLPYVWNSCIPLWCFSTPYCGHHARFCEKVCEQFMIFERMFLYNPPQKRKKAWCFGGCWNKHFMGCVNKSPNSVFTTFGFAIFPFTSFDLGDFSSFFFFFFFFKFQNFCNGWLLQSTDSWLFLFTILFALFLLSGAWWEQRWHCKVTWIPWWCLPQRYAVLPGCFCVKNVAACTSSLHLSVPISVPPRKSKYLVGTVVLLASFNTTQKVNSI